MADYHLPITPANEGGTANRQDCVGTGGYTLETYEPGVQATLKRRDNYWKDGRAHFDEIELLAIVDAATRQTAVATILDFPSPTSRLSQASAGTKRLLAPTCKRLAGVTSKTSGRKSRI